MAEGPEYYTTHYHGRSITQFLQTLLEHGVKTLVDTRSNPKSRLTEYCGENLRRTLEENSIRYVPAPQLGCPSHIRAKARRKGDYSELWEWYNKNVVEAVFWKFMGELEAHPKPVAFMCVEEDPAKCHRHMIAKALQQAGHRVKEI